LLVCLGLLCGLFCGRVAGSRVCCVQVGLRRTLGIETGGRHDGGVLRAMRWNVGDMYGNLAAIGWVYIITGDAIEEVFCR